MFIRFWNQFKYLKIVKGIVKKIKEYNKKVEFEYILEVYTKNNKCVFKNKNSQELFDEYINWVCSNGPYYKFKNKNGVTVFSKDKITSIEVYKKENK